MGYALMLGFCCLCHRQITFNPHAVPSIRMKNGKADETGTREPLCFGCATRLNELYVAAGKPSVAIRADAYEPIREEEL
jgi:hypothetical protein